MHGTTKMIRRAVIRCAWDTEASVWFVQDTDIAGLVTEAPTLDALRAKLPGMVRDLVEDGVEIELHLIALKTLAPTTANGVLGQAGLDEAF